MSVCLFSIEIQIPGLIRMKSVFTVHFGENFKKQKLQGTPDLVGAGHLLRPQIWIWKDLGPMSFWSHGHSHWIGVNKTKVVWDHPNSFLVGFYDLYSDPDVIRGPKGGQSGFRASAVHFGGDFIAQKLQNTPNLVGVGHLLGPQIWIQKGLGTVCIWNNGRSFQGEFMKWKL